MQTLGALEHLDYNEPGALRYEQAMLLIRRLGLAVPAVEEQFRRMVFNVVARNQDDHVKNIAFLMDRAGDGRSPPPTTSVRLETRNRWLDATKCRSTASATTSRSPTSRRRAPWRAQARPCRVRSSRDVSEAVAGWTRSPRRSASSRRWRAPSSGRCCSRCRRGSDQGTP